MNDEVGMMDVLSLLRELEWGSVRQDHPCCPSCGGWEPDGTVSLGEHSDGDWEGHRPNCHLAAALARPHPPLATRVLLERLLKAADGDESWRWIDELEAALQEWEMGK